MPDVRVRDAQVADAPAMASLLNRVVDEGDKTAIEHHLTERDVVEWFVTGPHARGCVVALDGADRVLGFQAVETFHDDLPEGWADIGTFVAAQARGTGVGHLLMTATLSRCREAGQRTLRAIIRSTNTGAIRYYRAMGFTDATGRGDLASGSVVLFRLIG
jgi:L-amino acid N-acyltransferase YncA